MSGWGSEMKEAKRALGDATEVEGWTLLVAQWLRLCDPRTRAWVPSLVEELRAGTLCGTAKKKRLKDGMREGSGRWRVLR